MYNLIAFYCSVFLIQPSSPSIFSPSPFLFFVYINYVRDVIQNEYYTFDELI